MKKTAITHLSGWGPVSIVIVSVWIAIVSVWITIVFVWIAIGYAMPTPKGGRIYIAKRRTPRNTDPERGRIPVIQEIVMKLYDTLRGRCVGRGTTVYKDMTSPRSVWSK